MFLFCIYFGILLVRYAYTAKVKSPLDISMTLFIERPANFEIAPSCVPVSFQVNFVGLR
jgi:hypothetical protein